MTTAQSFAADLEFLRSDPLEFTVRGRYSETCMLRTLAALNPDMAANEFILACAANGIHPTTARIQFHKSRAIDADLT